MLISLAANEAIKKCQTTAITFSRAKHRPQSLDTLNRGQADPESIQDLELTRLVLENVHCRVGFFVSWFLCASYSP